ncbi:SCO family protein [Oscillochloris sp. ZM17-4]|uniref:SCO family protein n=1 Tax=Oscillochloris sp. ZM17-4 TaxID=2866714 RepID=UPI001C72ADAD|nr:SCO family protein [Oscillochloris sp. ZM17-4]MBX0326632.1 SCO family protein [Oscillochloris sp. ZM17-4]
MPRIRLALLALLALLLSACATSATPTAPTAAGSVDSDLPTAGTEITPPKELTDFTLPSSEGGAPLSLSDLRGKPILLYFGYTFCPDVCPTTMSEFIRVKQDLGDQADQLTVLMVSVDPDRDTPEVMDRYMKAFDPSFIGMSGDDATLRKIGGEYGIYYKRHNVEGSSAAYLVDHSAATYLIDTQGRLRMVYSYGTPHTVMAPDVQRLIAEGS